MFKVLQVKELATMPKSSDAKALLEKLVNTTAKLLIHKKWKVGSLQEFFPKESHLLGLNVNAGSVIRIRLRDPNNSSIFLPWESLLGTMIHELVHIEISAHSAKFYEQVDKLYDIVEQGGSFPIDPFSGQSNRLGGRKYNCSLDLKETMAEAALKRQFNSGYCHVLGGENAKDWKQKAVNAALQRMDESTTQTSSSNQSVAGNVIKTATTSNSTTANDSQLFKLQSKSSVMKPVVTVSSNSSSSSSNSLASRNSLLSTNSITTAADTAWQCVVCTEENVHSRLTCKFCGLNRNTSFADNFNDLKSSAISIDSIDDSSKGSSYYEEDNKTKHSTIHQLDLPIKMQNSIGKVSDEVEIICIECNGIGCEICTNSKPSVKRQKVES